MNYKNRILVRGLFFLFTFIVFGYGIGVGHYHWPPFNTLRKMKTILAAKPKNIAKKPKNIAKKPNDIANEHIRHSDPGIVFESLRDDTEYYVILLAGQSNMVGEGNINDLEKNQYQLPANIDNYNFGRGYRLDYDLQRFGPEIALAHTLHSRFPEKNFVLLKYAVDRASLLDWSPEWTLERAAITGHPHFGALYQQFLEIIELITGGKNVIFVALLWLQGETDALIPEVGKAYYENFSQFVERFRHDLDMPNLPVLLGQINPPPGEYPAVEVVRDAQKQAAKVVKNVWLIDTDGISKWDDNLHYSSQGQLELGKRFAHILEGIIAAQGTVPDG